MSKVVRNDLWLIGMGWVLFLNGYGFAAAVLVLFGCFYLYLFDGVCSLTDALIAVLLVYFSGLAQYFAWTYLFAVTIGLNTALLRKIVPLCRRDDMRAMSFILGLMCLFFVLTALISQLAAYNPLSRKELVMVSFLIYLPYILALKNRREAVGHKNLIKLMYYNK